MDKNLLKARQTEILGLIKDFAVQKLNEEYVEMAERLVAKLARKRYSPLESERADVWAAAIVHVLGSINFLFDKASQPYATVAEINTFFKTNQSTTADKSRQIREMLNLGDHDDEFSIQRMHASNPFNKLVFMNGFLVPVNTLPEEYRHMHSSERR